MKLVRHLLTSVHFLPHGSDMRSRVTQAVGFSCQASLHQDFVEGCQERCSILPLAGRLLQATPQRSTPLLLLPQRQLLAHSLLQPGDLAYYVRQREATSELQFKYFPDPPTNSLRHARGHAASASSAALLRTSFVSATRRHVPLTDSA